MWVACCMMINVFAYAADLVLLAPSLESCVNTTVCC
jgi:hypothetical protein